jgi:hypothetical protein
MPRRAVSALPPSTITRLPTLTSASDCTCTGAGADLGAAMKKGAENSKNCGFSGVTVFSAHAEPYHRADAVWRHQQRAAPL